MKPIEIAGVPYNEIHDYSAGLGTYAGTRLVTLEDGVERGMRVVEMKSGGGLSIDITVDRGGDIGHLASNGQTLSWHGAGGLTSPWLMDREGDRGQGFLRGHGGFLNTCGLDHIRQPDRDKSQNNYQDAQIDIDYPLHGKGAFHPAMLRGHGLIDDVPEPYVFCETEFIQAMNFVSALRLRRRIEMPVGSQHVTITDVVRNVGNTPATHMLLYHFNLGFPMVAPGCQVNLGSDECVWHSEDHDPLARFPAPSPGSCKLISVFEHTSETAKVLLTSPQAAMQLQIKYPSTQLPYCQMLRAAEPGIYGIGIEPCTTAGRTRAEARERGEMIVLQPGEERQYCLSLNLAAIET